MLKNLDTAGKEFALYHLKKGKTIEDVTHLLTQNGYNYSEAFNYVSTLVITSNETAKATDKKNATVNILFGLLLLIIGLCITFTANSGIVAYGAIIVGITKTIRGISAASQN
jgi:hypothetical protein